MSEYEPPTLKSILSTWEPQLRWRRGARKRLAALDVYYDFRWKEVVGHERTMFRNGEDLADRIREDCPKGKNPVLLLTTREDIEKGHLHTNDANYVFVTNIHEIRAEARGGAALNYLVGGLGAGSLDTMRRFREAVSDPRQLDEILELSITRKGLARWADRKPERVAMLREIVGPHTTDAPVGEEDPSGREAARKFLRVVGPGALQGMADELASTAEGRRAIASSDQLAGRIQDARAAARDYRDLLAEPRASETDFQDFIKQNPLLLGLEYAEVMPRAQFLRGEIDFVVRRHDGYRDLLELKGPSDPIIRFRGEVEQRPSAYSLAPNLAQALAQVHLYREWIATASSENLNLYEVTRDPRITIIIGRDDSLPNETARKILRQVNVTLHRMSVLPYDILADRAEAQLDNLARFS